MSFMTYEQYAEIQCNSAGDPIQQWNPEIHGPLRQQYFAINRGDRWEMRTENGVPVYVPEDHESVRHWKDFWAAKRKAASEPKVW